MKKLIFIFILFSISSNSQTKIDVKYFTLGFVDDYMGRHSVISEKNNPKSISYITEDEKPSIKYLDSLIALENLNRKNNTKIDFLIYRDTLTENCTNCKESYKVESKRLATEINKMYYIELLIKKMILQNRDFMKHL